MLTLEFFTDDEALIRLAKDYWARDENDQWQFRPAELEQLHNVPRTRIPKIVAGSCRAIASDFRCSSCGGPSLIEKRPKFDLFKRAAQRHRSGHSGSGLTCSSCRELQLQQMHASLREKTERKNQVIAKWLQDIHQRPSSLSYAAMSIRHAFLLDGLLRYAVDDVLDGEDISPWTRHKVTLCDTTDDLVGVYKELFAAGWLTPSINSPLDAFSVSEDGQIAFAPLKVGWVINPDSGLRPTSAILDQAEAVLREATPTDLRPIWEWVCLCELRSHFDYCYGMFKFNGRGWTPGIENAVVQLLSECSLGNAKTVMHRTFKHLASELPKQIRHAQHTYNMLAGNLQRTHDYYRAQGWDLDPWRRRALSAEPIYSSHLFNRVLGGGTSFYNHLTGNGLESKGEPPPAA